MSKSKFVSSGTCEKKNPMLSLSNCKLILVIDFCFDFEFTVITGAIPGNGVKLKSGI